MHAVVLHVARPHPHAHFARLAISTNSHNARPKGEYNLIKMKSRTGAELLTANANYY